MATGMTEKSAGIPVKQQLWVICVSFSSSVIRIRCLFGHV